LVLFVFDVVFLNESVFERFESEKKEEYF